jgi:acetyl esterase/lipase
VPVIWSPFRCPSRQIAAVTVCGIALFGLSACGSTATSSTAATGVASSASTGGAPPAAAGSTTKGVARAAVKTQQGVAYATASASETLDLYLPASDGSVAVPVVVLIHGGAFAMGDSGMESQYAQDLVAQGFAVASVNYRLSGEATYPAGAQDVKAAVRWLRAHAAEYGFDTAKFAAWGQSAGGWMANMLGATGDQETIFDDASLGNADQSSAVQAVVSWFGPTNFATMDTQAKAVAACGSRSQVHGTADSPESQWLGGAVDSSSETPSTNISAYLADAETLPAWYIAHGDSDCNVPGGQSAELDAALKEAGATETYVVLKGAGHADPMFDQTQLEPTIDFLKQTLAV